MFNLIKADLYRIFNKKGIYVFAAVCSLGFLGMIYLVDSPNFTFSDYESFAGMVISFIPIIIGPFIIGLIYNDDLRSKSLQSAIGHGMKRSTIIITKFIVAMIMLGVILLGFLALLVSAPYMFAFAQGSFFESPLIKIFFTESLRSVVYIALTTMVVFVTQKPTVVTTVYLLLATQTLSGILSLILGLNFIVDNFGNVMMYLPTNLVTTFNSNLLQNISSYKEPFILAVMIVMSIIVSIVLFNKKELEF